MSPVFSSETDSETVLETFPLEESISVAGSDEETEPIKDTGTLGEHDQYAGECLGDSVTGKGQHVCCIPAVLSRDELQVPSTRS